MDLMAQNVTAVKMELAHVVQDVLVIATLAHVVNQVNAHVVQDVIVQELVMDI